MEYMNEMNVFNYLKQHFLYIHPDPFFSSEFLVKSLCDLSKPHGKTNQFPFVNPDHEVGFLAFFENQIIVCSLCESRILTRIHSLFQKQNHYVFSL